MAVNLKIVSQVATSGIPGPVGKSAYQIAVDNGFEGTESEWLKQLLPFKGWYDSVSDLEIAHANPILGDYAYVKGATSSDPIKIYECSTEGSWSDSGRTVDTSTVQTFGSGEAVNDVNITDDSSDIEENNDKIPTAGAVADALGNVEFSTGEKVKNVGIDAEPTAGSENFVKSGGVYEAIDQAKTNDYNISLYQTNTTAPQDSDRYNTNVFTLKEAIAQVPTAYRHGGLKLTFNSDSNYIVESYILENINWSTNVSLWKPVVNYLDIQDIRQKTVKLNKGFYIQNYNGGFRINDYTIALITEVMLLPTKQVTFYNYKNGGDLYYALVYLNQNYEIIGGTNFPSNNQYTFDPSIETIPESAKYIVIQSQNSNNAVYYISEETLGTGIDLRQLLLNKKDITDIQKDITDIQEDITNIQGDITDIQRDITKFVVKEDLVFLAKNVPTATELTESLINNSSYGAGKQFSVIDNSVVLTDAEGWTVRKYMIPHRDIMFLGTAPQSTADVLAVFDRNDTYMTSIKALDVKDDEQSLTSDRLFKSTYGTTGASYILLNTKDSDPHYVFNYVFKDYYKNIYWENDKLKLQVVSKNRLKPEINVTCLDGTYLESPGKFFVMTGNNTTTTYDCYSSLIIEVDELVGKKIFLKTKDYSSTLSMRFIDRFGTNGWIQKLQNQTSYVVQDGDKVLVIGVLLQGLHLSGYGIENYPNFNPTMLTDFLENVGIQIVDSTETDAQFDYYNESYTLETAPLNTDEQVINFKNLKNFASDNLKQLNGKINVANSDKIGIIGDSYTASLYSLPNKSYIAKLSMFSDYEFVNFGLAGDIYIGRMYDVRRGASLYGTLPYEGYKPKYSMLCCFTNDLKYMDMEHYLDCLQNAITFFRGIGSEPIVCTEYHTDSNPLIESAMFQVAKNNDCLFFGISSYCKNLIGNKYIPFWNTSHAGTRTNNIESDPYEYCLNSLERPMQSLKLFRPRNSWSSLDDLMFKNNYQRAKLFNEIIVGDRCLSNNTEVDSCDNSTSSTEQSEYGKLIQKTPIEFSNAALISVVLPSVSKDITYIALEIDCNVVPSVFVQKRLTSPYPIPTKVANFNCGNTSFTQTPEIDAVYADSVTGENYTVKEVLVDSFGDYHLLCQGNTTIPATTYGTLSKISGIGDSQIEYNLKEIGYTSDVFGADTIGHYEEILSNEDGLYDITSIIEDCVNYDKVNFLVTYSGTFTLSDVQVHYSSNVFKVTHRKTPWLFTSNYLNNNTELLPSSTFGTAGELDTNWNVTPSLTYEQTQGTNVLPNQFISKVTVNDTVNLSHTIPNSSLRPYGSKAMLEIWCRYFPDVYVDGSGNQITTNSFDYNEIYVDLYEPGKPNKTSTLRDKVGTHWKQIKFEIVVKNSDCPIKIYSNSKGIEIAYISMKFNE